jgi:hypothetical protein
MRAQQQLESGLFQHERRLRSVRRKAAHAISAATCGLGVLMGALGQASSQEAKPAALPTMAPIEQYRVASREEEIALARSAAPASISGKAEIMVLGAQGYETAVKGTNGFVCLVERSWFASFGDPQFWNPRIRGPDCLNPAAVKSVLPVDLERTQWVLAGVSEAEMQSRTLSSAVAKQAPASGSMGYMMSKQGHLSDRDGHWHPHVMFFLPHSALSVSGANLPGSPVFGQEGGANEATVLFVTVGQWSDGSSGSM